MPCSWQKDPELYTASCYMHKLYGQKMSLPLVSSDSLNSLYSNTTTKLTLNGNGFGLRGECRMLTLVIHCMMMQCTVTQNLRIQLILLLILLIFCFVSITYCFTWAFWYLLSITLSFIILYSVSARSWLHAAQSHFNSGSCSCKV